MYPYLLVINLFINGVWVNGNTIDGWGDRPQLTISACHQRQSDLYEWFMKVGPFETPYGKVTQINATCVKT